MLVPRQQYSRELKIAAMREIESGKSIAEVARMFQVSPKRLEIWKGEWRAKGEMAQDRTAGDGDRVPKKSLAAFQGASPDSRRQWQRRLYQQIRQAAKTGAAVNGLCQAAGVSRTGYYRFLVRPQPQEAGMDLRSQIQRIALRWPAYGYRRVHAELLRHGWTVNHKRILRLMRADNLLCLRRRKFILTTDSKHGLPIYPNLADGMELAGIDQLWVADITYIRLQLEFVYLAVLLDAFSRRCIGWALQRSLEAALALEALRMALMQRHPKPGLVHHSDRGVQYASRDYTAELELHGIRISMSRLATPYDNAQAESFIKTLKYEEVYRTEYRNLEGARASIGEFLDKIYNQQRLHSALGYRPPLEFERSLRPLRAVGKGRA
jgi:putative transposase